MEQGQSERERKQIEAVVFAFFEAGRNKDLPSLGTFHAPIAFTKFDENPPYTRQNSDEAFVYEQAAFANISDYSYQIDDLRIDMVGDAAAIATFYLAYQGMFVNDYSFEGSPVSSRDRVTMVFSKTRDGWRIIHEHFSRFPDWNHSSQGKSSANR